MSRYQIYQYRFIVVIAVLCFYSFLLTGQSPYEVTFKKDIPILVGGLIGQTTGLILTRRVDPLSDAAIEALNIEDINSFDRKGVFNYSSSARKLSDVFLVSSYSYPLLVFIGKDIRTDFLKMFLIGAEAFTWNVGLTTIAKGLAKRARPFTYNPDVDIDEKRKRTSRLSFFSGHACSVSTASFFTAKVFSDYYPDSKWKPVVWTAATLIPATTGYLRIKAGKHFRTDAMTGTAVGALIGILIPHLHKKKDKNKNVSLTILPVVDGAGLTLKW